MTGRIHWLSHAPQVTLLRLCEWPKAHLVHRVAQIALQGLKQLAVAWQKTNAPDAIKHGDRWGYRWLPT
jgi:hypothetical protein